MAPRSTLKGRTRRGGPLLFSQPRTRTACAWMRAIFTRRAPATSASVVASGVSRIDESRKENMTLREFKTLLNDYDKVRLIHLGDKDEFLWHSDPIRVDDINKELLAQYDMDSANFTPCHVEVTIEAGLEMDCDRKREVHILWIYIKDRED